MPFLPQFYKMIDFLQEKGMIVHHVWVNPPQENDILEVEIELGYELDKSITDFYMECNGVQLLWSHPENTNLDKKIKFVGSKHFLNGYSITDDFSFDGAILIEPIKEVFLTDWYNHIYFDFTIKDKREIIFANKIYIEPDFSQRIKPFDMYNIFNEHAFFLDGSSNPLVIMGDDYQACYTDSFLMNFSDYLEFILYHYGVVQARRDFFSKYNGHTYQPKTITDFWKYPQIDLDKFDTGNNHLIVPFEKKFWS